MRWTCANCSNWYCRCQRCCDEQRCINGMVHYTVRKWLFTECGGIATMEVFYKMKIPAMDQLTLYDQILGLSSPWGTRSVDLNELSGDVVVTVSYDRDSSASCPVCQQPCRHYDSRARTWRHLDTCQYKTIIQADVPRVECPEHGVLTVQVPWANSSSHYTMLFELRVLK